MSEKNRKFINAFTSFKMIGDYGEQGENTETKPDSKNTENDSTYNKDDLYDPTISMDSEDENNDSAANDTTANESSLQHTVDISDPSENEDDTAAQSDANFSLQKSPEKKNDAVSSSSDDELLGKALADLEEDEKEEDGKNEKDDEGEPKKKKKKKDKDKEKDDKKKKKKKKRKKAKDKSKDKDIKEKKKGNHEDIEYKEKHRKEKKEKKSRRSESKDRDVERKSHRSTSKNNNDKSERGGGENKSHQSVSKNRDGSKRHRSVSKDRNRKHRNTSKDREESRKHKRSSSKDRKDERKHQRESDEKRKHGERPKQSLQDENEKHKNAKRDERHRKRSHRSVSPESSPSKRSRHSHQKSPDSKDKQKDHKRRSSIDREKESDRRLSKSDTNQKSGQSLSDQTPELLSKNQFLLIQKVAQKDITRQISSDSSHGEQQRLVIEDTEANKANIDLTKDDDKVIQTYLRSPPPPPPPPRRENHQNHISSNSKQIIKIETDDVVDFVRDKTEIYNFDENDMYDAAFQSENANFDEPRKSLKPSALSINEYKQRRKSGKDSRLSTSSQSEDESRIKHTDRNSQESKETETIQIDTSPSKLNNTKENITPVPDERPENGSPYNPEASPIDLDPSPEPFGQNGKASPSQAAVEDNNVDIMAYKGISAFDNIMKSKVKHEAKKHKRKKLEEMKHDLEQKSGVATSKEKRLVDYMNRQEQVEEIMKTTLKAYFKKKEITKGEYKYILKKAVPQVTMSGSSIVPEKIESLIVKFVRKCKGRRNDKKYSFDDDNLQNDVIEEHKKQLQMTIESNQEMMNMIGGFETTALNPNLPLPPI